LAALGDACCFPLEDDVKSTIGDRRKDLPVSAAPALAHAAARMMLLMTAQGIAFSLLELYIIASPLKTPLPY
jgi:hypothetical protein